MVQKNWKGLRFSASTEHDIDERTNKSKKERKNEGKKEIQERKKESNARDHKSSSHMNMK